MTNDVALFSLYQHKPFSTIGQEDTQSHNSYNGTLIMTNECIYSFKTKDLL